MTRIQPLGGRVLVRPITVETTPGGIILAHSAQERPQEGTVVAVGHGKLLDNGDMVSTGPNVGDTVIYAKYGGTELKVDGADHLILDESSILAVKSVVAE